MNWRAERPVCDTSRVGLFGLPPGPLPGWASGLLGELDIALPIRLRWTHHCVWSLAEGAGIAFIFLLDRTYRMSYQFDPLPDLHEEHAVWMRDAVLPVVAPSTAGEDEDFKRHYLGQVFDLLLFIRLRDRAVHERRFRYQLWLFYWLLGLGLIVALALLVFAALGSGHLPLARRMMAVSLLLQALGAVLAFHRSAVAQRRGVPLSR